MGREGKLKLNRMEWKILFPFFGGSHTEDNVKKPSGGHAGFGAIFSAFP